MLTKLDRALIPHLFHACQRNTLAAALVALLDGLVDSANNPGGQATPFVTLTSPGDLTLATSFVFANVAPIIQPLPDASLHIGPIWFQVDDALVNFVPTPGQTVNDGPVLSRNSTEGGGRLLSDGVSAWKLFK